MSMIFIVFASKLLSFEDFVCVVFWYQMAKNQRLFAYLLWESQHELSRFTRMLQKFKSCRIETVKMSGSRLNSDFPMFLYLPIVVCRCLQV